MAGADDREPSSFQPLPTAALYILLALTEGEKHGYALLGDMERLSDGAVKVGAGTLYGSIKRMLADGLIQESEERPDPALDDQRRRYYRLTGLGQRVADAELRRLATLLQRAGARAGRRARLGEA
jgi:DNA-binding PadR family transcriptional regulator